MSDKPIKLIINTHAHADHFGANEALAKGGASIVAHDNLRERMAKGQSLAAFKQTIPPSPPAALPTLTYADAMTLHFDGETVQLFHPPGAHTDNDTLVHFKRANVIHASGTIGGDGGYPFFDMSSGGSLAGMIAAEDKISPSRTTRPGSSPTRAIRQAPRPSRRPATCSSRSARGSEAHRRGQERGRGGGHQADQRLRRQVGASGQFRHR